MIAFFNFLQSESKTCKTACNCSTCGIRLANETIRAYQNGYKAGQEKQKKGHDIEMAVEKSSKDMITMEVKAEIKKKCEGMKYKIYPSSEVKEWKDKSKCLDYYNQALDDLITNL